MIHVAAAANIMRYLLHLFIKREKQCDCTAMTCPIVIEALIPKTIQTDREEQ